MNSGTMSGAALSLGAAGVWGGGDFAGAIAAKRASVFRVVAVAHAFGLVLMLVLVWISGEPMPPLAAFGWGAVAGITDAFGVAALYKGLSTGRMGVVAPGRLRDHRRAAGALRHSHRRTARDGCS